MAPYLGDFPEDATVHFMWDTTGSSGQSITRATDGTVQVYKDNGVTQSTAGVTDTEDFDSLTGVHACTIDTSADAFYAAGHNYTVVLSAATIDGQTVNAVLAHFSIENRSIKAGDAMDLVTDAVDAAAVKTDAVTEIQNGLATAANLTIVDTVVDAIKAKTDNLPASPAAVGSAMTLAANAVDAAALAADAVAEIVAALENLSQADAQAACAAALTAYDPPTKAEMDTGHSSLATAASLQTVDDIVDAILIDTDTTLPGLIAALNNLSQAQAEAACDAALASYDPPTKTEQDAQTTTLLSDHTTIKNGLISILADTGTDIPNQIAALNNLSQAQAQTAATAALTAYDPPTHAEVTAATQSAKLGADGLDSIAGTEPTGVPSTFKEKLLWLVQRFTRAKIHKTGGGTADLYVQKVSDGATLTTQALTEDTTDQTVGAPS